MSANGSGPSGIGRAERLADRQAGHVDPRRDGQRHRAREARVDLQQRGHPGRVELDLDVGHGREGDPLRDGARERLEPLVVQGAPRHGDPRVDLQALARDDAGDVPVGPRDDVERVLGPRQVLLHEQRPVALERLQLGADLDEPDAAGAAARPGLDDHRQRDGRRVERRVDQERLRDAHVPAAARGERPFVEARAERLLRGEHEGDPGGGVVLAPLREREQLGVDRGDDHVDAVAPAALQEQVGEARVVAARQDRAAVGRDEVQAGGERVDVGGEHRDGLALHRAQDRDARRAAGAGHEDAPHVSGHRRCSRPAARPASHPAWGTAACRCRGPPRAARRSAPGRSAPSSAPWSAAAPRRGSGGP